MRERIARSLGAGTVLAALLVGVPLLLLRYGPALPHRVPSGAQLRDAPGQALTDNAVFTILTIAAWFAWAMFSTSVVTEFVAELRGATVPRLPLPSLVQAGARQLVAALLMSTTLTGPLASHRVMAAPALPGPSARPVAAVATLAPPPPPSAPAQSPRTTPPAELPAITVVTGDSPWSLAERHLANGTRWRDMWELNKGVTQPDGRAWVVEDQIDVGWRLRLPADATGVPIPSPDPASAEGQVLVRSGDTLREIARDRLGDPDRYPELFDATTDIVQPDGRHLIDPDLILPGWTVRIPAVSPPTVPHPADPPPPVAPRPPATETVPTTPPSSAPPSSAPTPTTDSTPSTAATTAATPASSPGLSGETSPQDEASGSREPTPERQGVLESSAPFLAGITGATVLATGLAVLLRRRRQRLATGGGGLRWHHRDSALADAEMALVSASDLPLVRWAGQELAQMVAGLDPRQITGAPVAVELSEQFGIEVLWDVPQPEAPTRWVAADGGWAWRLPYDPDAPTPADSYSSPIPALVTIGWRDGRQLLLDLEAVGSLAVTGDSDAVESFVRSLVLELGSDEDLADAYLDLAGIEVEGSEHLDRVSVAELFAATDRLAAATEACIEAIAETPSGSSFAFRAGRHGGHLEAQVVVASLDPAMEEELVDAAPPHRGVAAVVIGAVVNAGAHLAIDKNGSAHLEPLGLDFQAVGMPANTAARVQQLLEAQPETDDAEPCSDAVMGTSPIAISPVIDLRFGPDQEPGQAASLGHNGHGPPTSNGHRQDATSLVAPLGEEVLLRSAPASTNGSAPSSSGPKGPGSAGVTTPASAARGRSAPPEPEPQLLVRVLGVPNVPTRPMLNRRELVLAVYLACKGGAISASSVQDAVWNGRAVQDKTLWNLVARTRSTLGSFDDGRPVLPQADRTDNTLHLADGVSTDTDLLRERYERALHLPADQAIPLLVDGLDLVEGPPFDAPGYDWAHHTLQLVAEASDLIERATLHLVNLATASDDVDTARHAIVQGLRGLPGNEALYRSRMTLEHGAGNMAAVKGAYVELLGFLADLDADPSNATQKLYESFTRPARPAGPHW